MKKIITCIIALILLSSCSESFENETDVRKQDMSDIPHTVNEASDKYEFRGVWIPVYELAPNGNNKSDFVKKLEVMCKNMETLGITDVFVQVRANGDAVYPSDIFPPSPYFSDKTGLYYDALEIMCREIHSYNMKIHAWINPYRLCSDVKNGTYVLPKGIENEDIFEYGNKLYLVPASEKARELILSGVREIFEKYDVDGVHIDDYFYPTVKKEVDEVFYSDYTEKGGRESLPDFRRNNVNALVSSIYAVAKKYGKDKIFSVSPGGNIGSDYEKLYADVEKWCSEFGYSDLIIPQIYFGFENESQPFRECLSSWKKMTSDYESRLIIGLSVYKSGKADKYAGSGGKNEWKENDDILKREILLIRKEKCRGFCLFSYNYIFGNREFTEKEINNAKSVL